MKKELAAELVAEHSKITKPGYLVNFDKLQEGVRNPLVQIEYENPITPVVDGVAIWERLPWESAEDYKNFVSYRNMGVDRVLFNVAKQAKMVPREMIMIAKVYHWDLRVRAYDYYQATIWEFRKKERQREIADSHYQVATDLFKKCADYCAMNINVFKPKDVIQLMKMASDLGRQSVDLYNGNGRGAGMIGDGQGPIITINNQQTQLGGQQGQMQQVAPQGEVIDVEVDEDKEKERLAGIANILYQIGALSPKESVREELNANEVIIK